MAIAMQMTTKAASDPPPTTLPMTKICLADSRPVVARGGSIGGSGGIDGGKVGGGEGEGGVAGGGGSDGGGNEGGGGATAMGTITLVSTEAASTASTLRLPAPFD